MSTNEASPLERQKIFSLNRGAALTENLEQALRVQRKKIVFALLYAAIILSLVVYVALNLQTIHEVILKSDKNPLLRFFLGPSLVWFGLVIVLMVFRTVVWFFYRPERSVALEEAPSLTVIIPAFNEGAMVLNSITSVVESHYPADRLEIFVVDDGSKDDTWNYIQQAVERFPGRITPVRFPQNRGKRAALSVGFEKARGDFVVTLDSDSILDPDALLAVVAPFKNPRVGAVAGRVAVYNSDEGLIPKMLHTRFVLTFDVMRAVESSYGTVFCTPGALSAYRISAVRKVLERWKTQTFLGSACTFGEDRALTNDLLNEGYDTRYQGSAIVHTIVPTTYSKLSKMFLRWDRSYVREEIRLMKIVWKRPPLARILTLFDRLTTNFRYPISLLAVFAFFAVAVTTPALLLRVFGGMLLISVLNSLYYLRSEMSATGFLHSVAFSFYSSFTMWWIMPYAFFTVKAKGWLTR
jgi:hyaluronan synthase